MYTNFLNKTLGFFPRVQTKDYTLKIRNLQYIAWVIKKLEIAQINWLTLASQDPFIKSLKIYFGPWDLSRNVGLKHWTLMVIVKDPSSHLLYLNRCIKWQTCEIFKLNRSSKLRDNNERKNTLITRSCVLSDAWFRDLKF